MNVATMSRDISLSSYSLDTLENEEPASADLLVVVIRRGVIFVGKGVSVTDTSVSNVTLPSLTLPTCLRIFISRAEETVLSTEVVSTAVCVCATFLTALSIKSFSTLSFSEPDVNEDDTVLYVEMISVAGFVFTRLIRCMSCADISVILALFNFFLGSSGVSPLSSIPYLADKASIEDFSDLVTVLLSRWKFLISSGVSSPSSSSLDVSGLSVTLLTSSSGTSPFLVKLSTTSFPSSLSVDGASPFVPI